MAFSWLWSVDQPDIKYFIWAMCKQEQCGFVVGLLLRNCFHFWQWIAYMYVRVCSNLLFVVEKKNYA